MKAKTIRSVLRRKTDAWIASVEDPELRTLVQRDTVITGGAIASMLLGEDVRDYDVYFRTRETTARVARYYLARFTPKLRTGIATMMQVDESLPDRIRIIIKSAGIASEGGTDRPYEYFEGSREGAADAYVGDVMEDSEQIEDTREEIDETLALGGGAKKPKKKDEKEEKPSYRPVFLSTNAVTLSDQLQLILRFYGEPDAIHENYDFAHCTNYWQAGDGTLTLRQPALEALLARELRYVGSKYPVCSLIRMRKFIRRGWTISAGQVLKIALQVSELDLTDYKVLEEQLIGVDVAYFTEILAKVREKDPEKVGYAYLVEILDRLL